MLVQILICYTQRSIILSLEGIMVARARTKRKVETFIEEGRNGNIYRKIDTSESTFSKIAKITKWRSETELEILSANTHDCPVSAPGPKKQMISVTGTGDDLIGEGEEVVLRLCSLDYTTQDFHGSVDTINYHPTADGSKFFTASIYVNKAIATKASQLC